MLDKQPEHETTSPLPVRMGRGGDGEIKRSELAIERTAAKRWNIPDKYKDAIVNRQVKIAVDSSSSNREATSAARVLATLEAQNQLDEMNMKKSAPETIAGIDVLSEIRLMGQTIFVTTDQEPGKESEG